MKAKTIQQWYKSEEDPQEAEASKEPHTKRGSNRAKKEEPKEDPKEPYQKRIQKRIHKIPKEEPKEAEPKAEGDAQAQQVRTAGKRGVKNADAVIMSAYGSSNASTGRFDIQGTCKLADGSI